MNNSEARDINEIPLSPEGIPMEFAEIPENFESAYISVSNDSIEFVSKNGFSPKYNNWHKNPTRKKAEDILDEVAAELGILKRRKSCVYAQPAPDNKEGWIMGDDNRYVIEVMIDPEHARVAAAATFEYVVGEALVDPKRAKRYALDYWVDSISLEEFNKNPDKYKNWRPEILYSEDIPLKHVRLVHTPISN